MRQVVVTRYGPADVLEVRERPDPMPAEGEIRVRVRAAGVNFADILARMGLYPEAPRPPAVIGYEVAGHVDALGSGVTGLTTGDRVLAFTHFGGYSESVIVPAWAAFRVPRDLSDAEAAAIPVNYLTAVVALYKLANLSPGETVLVHGAGGGVGVAAIQLARLRRARIIGTASAMKHDALRAFGVDHAIDYRTADVEREVRQLTGGRGVDVILDSLGGRSFETSYRLLAPLGRLVLFGVSGIAPGERRRLWYAMREWMRMPRFSPLSLINRNRGVFGLHLGHLWNEKRQLVAPMELLLGEFASGRLRPVLAKSFPLDRAPDAHRFMQNRMNVGKVVLTT
jgi:NADPH:quinone reductase-like Zn-dependent oxidoreductase